MHLIETPLFISWFEVIILRQTNSDLGVQFRVQLLRTRSPDKNYQIHLLLILSQRLLRTIHIQSESRFAKMILIINFSLETFSEWKYVIRDFLLFRQNGCIFQKLNRTLEIIVNVGKKLDRKKRGAEETWFAGGLTQPLN